MIYLLNLILATSYLYIFRNKKINFLIFMPILIIWSFILGLQYEVGTDYQNYLLMFNNKKYLKLYFFNKEYLYYYFITGLNYFNIKGQAIFYSISIIQIILFYMVQQKYNLKKIYIFVFLYLTVGSTFYSQMNVIRSQTASYFLTLCLLNSELYKKIFYFCLGMNIHRSLILMLPLVYLDRIAIKIGKKTLLYFLMISIIISLLPLIKLLKNIVYYIPRYSHYLNYNYFSELPLFLKITKYIYIPIYLRALKFSPNNYEEEKIFKLGIIAVIIRIICLSSTVTNRLGEYFIILGLYPLYYYFSDLKKDKRFKILFLILIILIFIIKVLILPRGEYDYKSYLFI